MGSKATVPTREHGTDCVSCRDGGPTPGGGPYKQRLFSAKEQRLHSWTDGRVSFGPSLPCSFLWCQGPRIIGPVPAGWRGGPPASPWISVAPCYLSSVQERSIPNLHSVVPSCLLSIFNGRLWDAVGGKSSCGPFSCDSDRGPGRCRSSQVSSFTRPRELVIGRVGEGLALESVVMNFNEVLAALQ